MHAGLIIVIMHMSCAIKIQILHSCLFFSCRALLPTRTIGLRTRRRSCFARWDFQIISRRRWVLFCNSCTHFEQNLLYYSKIWLRLPWSITFVMALGQLQLVALFTLHSVIADSVLQRAFAAATGNFRPFSALKSIHIWSLISLL